MLKGFRARSLAIRGGNSNNDAQCGTFYLNLNNTVSNANWNITAALSYLYHIGSNALCLPQPLLKIDSLKASVSSLSKMDERIRSFLQKVMTVIEII